MQKVKARFGGSGRIVVDYCPFCHHTHYHNQPVGEGQRMADCFKGEYLLDFEDTPNKASTLLGAGVAVEDQNDVAPSG